MLKERGELFKPIKLKIKTDSVFFTSHSLDVSHLYTSNIFIHSFEVVNSFALKTSQRLASGSTHDNRQQQAWWRNTQ